MDSGFIACIFLPLYSDPLNMAAAAQAAPVEAAADTVQAAPVHTYLVDYSGSTNAAWAGNLNAAIAEPDGRRTLFGAMLKRCATQANFPCRILAFSGERASPPVPVITGDAAGLVSPQFAAGQRVPSRKFSGAWDLGYVVGCASDAHVLCQEVVMPALAVRKAMTDPVDSLKTECARLRHKFNRIDRHNESPRAQADEANVPHVAPEGNLHFVTDGQLQREYDPSPAERAIIMTETVVLLSEWRALASQVNHRLGSDHVPMLEVVIVTNSDCPSIADRQSVEESAAGPMIREFQNKGMMGMIRRFQTRAPDGQATHLIKTAVPRGCLRDFVVDDGHFENNAQGWTGAFVDLHAEARRLRDHPDNQNARATQVLANAIETLATSFLEDPGVGAEERSHKRVRRVAHALDGVLQFGDDKAYTKDLVPMIMNAIKCRTANQTLLNEQIYDTLKQKYTHAADLLLKNAWSALDVGPNALVVSPSQQLGPSEWSPFGVARASQATHAAKLGADTFAVGAQIGPNLILPTVPLVSQRSPGLDLSHRLLLRRIVAAERKTSPLSIQAIGHVIQQLLLASANCSPGSALRDSWATKLMIMLGKYGGGQDEQLLFNLESGTTALWNEPGCGGADDWGIWQGGIATEGAPEMSFAHVWWMALLAMGPVGSKLRKGQWPYCQPRITGIYGDRQLPQDSSLLDQIISMGWIVCMETPVTWLTLPAALVQVGGDCYFCCESFPVGETWFADPHMPRAGGAECATKLGLCQGCMLVLSKHHASDNAHKPPCGSCGTLTMYHKQPGSPLDDVLPCGLDQVALFTPATVHKWTKVAAPLQPVVAEADDVKEADEASDDGHVDDIWTRDDEYCGPHSSPEGMHEYAVRVLAMAKQGSALVANRIGMCIEHIMRMYCTEAITAHGRNPPYTIALKLTKAAMMEARVSFEYCSFDHYSPLCAWDLAKGNDGIVEPNVNASAAVQRVRKVYPHLAEIMLAHGGQVMQAAQEAANADDECKDDV